MSVASTPPPALSLLAELPGTAAPLAAPAAVNSAVFQLLPLPVPPPGLVLETRAVGEAGGSEGQDLPVGGNPLPLLVLPLPLPPQHDGAPTIMAAPNPQSQPAKSLLAGLAEPWPGGIHGQPVEPTMPQGKAPIPTMATDQLTNSSQPAAALPPQHAIKPAAAALPPQHAIKPAAAATTFVKPASAPIAPAALSAPVATAPQAAPVTPVATAAAAPQAPGTVAPMPSHMPDSGQRQETGESASRAAPQKVLRPASAAGVTAGPAAAKFVLGETATPQELPVAKGHDVVMKATDLLPVKAEPLMVASAPTMASEARPSSPSPAVVMQLSGEVGQPEWADALGERISWLVDRDLTRAQLKLNPPMLGPLELRVRIDGDQANIALATHSNATREALEQALPRLREMLTAQGFAGVNVSVSQHPFSERSGREGGFGDADPVDAPTESRAAATTTTPTRRQALLDAYA